MEAREIQFSHIVHRFQPLRPEQRPMLRIICK